MDDQNKQKYSALYQEFLELKAKVDYAFQVRSVIPNQPLEIRTAPSLEEIDRLGEIANILIKEGKKFLDLNPGEWYEISERAELHNA